MDIQRAEKRRAADVDMGGTKNKKQKLLRRKVKAKTLGERLLSVGIEGSAAADASADAVMNAGGAGAGGPPTKGKAGFSF